jgi:hypothetical protein
MTDGRRRRLILLACVSVAATLVMDAGSRSFGAVPTRASCGERPAFRAKTTRWFDSWSLPESVVRSSTPDRTRGCSWIASVRGFVPVPGVSAEQAAADLAATLGEQDYDLAHRSDGVIETWSTRTCPHQVRCDLVLSVVDSPSGRSIEAEFVRNRTRCHPTVAAFRLKAAAVFDTWDLPDGVVRSSSSDRASGVPCWWIESVRRFVPREGVSLRSAGARLVAALQDQGYNFSSADEDISWWRTRACPGQLACDLTISIDHSQQPPRLEASFVR